MRESFAARIGVHTAWSCRIPVRRLSITLSVFTLIALCPLSTRAADPNINGARFPLPTPLSTAIPTLTPTPTDTPTPTQMVPTATPTTAPTPTATQTPPTPSATTAPTPTNTPTVPPTATPTVAPTSVSGPTAGMMQIGDGNASFYSATFDNGGWDKIIQARLRNGQGDPKTFAFSPDGFYCVHPDFTFGDVLMLQNVATGKTVRCTVADAVASPDQPIWRSHWVIETSYALFAALGLDRTNHVTVWAAPKSSP